MEPGDYAIRGGIIDIFPPVTRRLCAWICLAMFGWGARFDVAHSARQKSLS